MRHHFWSVPWSCQMATSWKHVFKCMNLWGHISYLDTTLSSFLLNSTHIQFLLYHFSPTRPKRRPEKMGADQRWRIMSSLFCQRGKWQLMLDWWGISKKKLSISPPDFHLCVHIFVILSLGSKFFAFARNSLALVKFSSLLFLCLTQENKTGKQDQL